MNSYLEELREQARPVACHEAGHYIVARVLGFETGGIHVGASPFGTRGKSEIFLHGPIKSVDDVVDYARRRTQVVLAGVMAEHFTADDIDETAAREALTTTATDDWTKARENLRTVCSILHPNAGQQLGALLEHEAVELMNKAAALVRAERPLIETLAARLLLEFHPPGEATLSADTIDGMADIANRFHRP